MRSLVTVVVLAMAGAHLGCTDDVDPTPEGRDGCEQLDHDVVVTSADDAAGLPERCFTASGYTVTVAGSSLEDLRPLHGLREVGRLILESNPALKTTEGLADLRVLSELRVEDNAVLVALPGFGRTEVLDRVALVDNPQLADLSGLAQVKVIKGELAIEGASALGDLEDAWRGVSLLEGIGTLKILDTSGLRTSGVPLLSTVASDFLVQGNLDLQSLGGFSRLSDVGRHFTIQANPVLEDLGAFTLKFQTVGGCLTVRDNPRLSAESVEQFMAWIYKVGGCVNVANNGTAQAPPSFSSEPLGSPKP